MGKKPDKLDLGFMKPAVACVVLGILLFSNAKRASLNSITLFSWGGVPLSQLPLIDGIFNAFLALALTTAYTAALLAAYYRLQNTRLRLGDDLTAAVAYAVMALLMTYPLVFYYTNHTPGDNKDTSKFIWNLWWTGKSVAELRNPFYSDYIFYPKGTSLVFDTYSFLLGVLSIPMQYTVGLVTAYNTLILLGVIWSGLGMYKLVEHLTQRRDVAFVCGLAFAFMPYRMAHMLGHLNLVSTQWIPFYMLHLIKAMDKGGRRDSILAAVFLAAAFYTELTYVMFMALFTAILAGARIHGRPELLRSGQFAGNVKAFAAASAVLTLPMLYIIATSYGLYSHLGNYNESVLYSADLLAFIVPSSMNTVLGPYSKLIEGRFTGYMAEKTVYLGWGVIVLGTLAFAKTERLLKKKFVADFSREKTAWGIAAIAFLILSLGPVLHFYGLDVEQSEEGKLRINMEKTIPLPYKLLMDLPFISMSRVPARFSFGVSFSLIVLAGYSLKSLAEAKRLGKSLLAVASMLIVFEFMTVPYPIADMSYNPFYKQIAAYAGDFVVYHIPGTSSPYYQTIHGKRMIGGAVARMPSDVEQWGEQITADLEGMTMKGFAGKYRVSYFILQRKLMKKPDEALNMFTKNFGKPAYMDEELAVYETDAA